MLGPDEIERYRRHLVLREVGGPGQHRLKAARVLIVGAGGLGSPVALYLAAAGVGHLTLVDDDRVALSNLQRQILHGTEDVDRPKVESAAETLARLNPHVTVTAIAARLEADNAAALLAGQDVVVDGTDGFAVRALLADAAEAARVPLVTAAVGRFDGSLTTLTPWETGPDGALRPRFADLFPRAPRPGVLPACAETGVLGAVTGVLGTLQATEVLKLILGIGEPLIGRLLLVDLLDMRFETIAYRRRASAPM
ncbi:HesA/MoeB/ThiF family protein [Segnochrobactraceae bacterium EtOH-i3]